MHAEIIACGSELLTSKRVDTNSLYLTDQLNALGVEVVIKCVVGDDRDRLADSIRRAFQSVQIVIVTGGLGPTEDDVTRDAVAGDARGRDAGVRSGPAHRAGLQEIRESGDDDSGSGGGHSGASARPLRN